MIKLNLREMKSLSRILTALLCFAPLAYANAAGPVATTSGSNLTAFNPSNANNNQWATMSNGRYDGNTSAKADFGNCNSIVLRCATPKCANGGCSDITVASSIVSGCVKSNDTCKKYGDDLVQYMSAQLVASSNAKINEQQLAAQQAAAQAQAAAVAAANEQSQQQMAAMRQQMQQMQQQMQQQQAESAAQLQEALAQQAAQSAAAVESMKSAATAAAVENEAGVSAYQQDAINRGISADVLERKKIGGQVMTEIEDAEVSLKEAKTAMQSAFTYAHCDNRGGNCEGPKRIKKWRELALKFVEPYNNSIDKIYDALMVAQSVGGIDLSDIYMMLNNSCNSWGQYMCQGGEIEYVGKSTPWTCPGKNISKQLNCQKDENQEKCKERILEQEGCQRCTLLKVLTNKDEVYEGWVNPTVDESSNGTVIACASGALDSSAFFASRARRKNGANLVDIDKMEIWLNQKEPNKTKNTTSSKMMSYCDIYGHNDILEKAVASKSALKVNGYPLCIKEIKESDNGLTSEDREECGYISPIFAMCDTHPYNAGKDSMTAKITDDDNCTSDAQKDYKDNNGTHIVWAEKEGNPKTCKVKYCDSGYIVKDGNQGCREINTDDTEDKKAAEEQKAEYNRYMARYSEISEIKEIVALKTTVISQQMYKEYEYLNATIRRLKTQLEKATLNATLQAAGAKTETSSGLLGSGSISDDKTIHLAGANNCSNFMDFDSAYNCLQTNVSLIKNNVSSNAKKACLQLQETVVSAKAILSKTSIQNCGDYEKGGKTCGNSDKTAITTCADSLNMAVMQEKRTQANEARKYQKGD